MGQVRMIVISPERINVLPAAEARFPPEPSTRPYIEGGDPKVFAVAHWKQADQGFTWSVNIADKGDYEVAILCAVKGLDPGSRLNLQVSDGKATLTRSVTDQKWDRVWLTGSLSLPAGAGELQLKMTGLAPGARPDINIYSIELTTAATIKNNAQAAAALRSRPAWLSAAKYGLFFHWNSKSMPRNGPPLSYDSAVKGFDVEQFSKMVNGTGAGFIVLTTSWAGFYFPGPLDAIDKILPGRTSRRDLVSDLSDALAKYHIRLLLYYNFHGDMPDWWPLQKFSPSRPGQMFGNMIDIFGEISRRYGKKIAGLWVDDGMGLYPYDAPFEELTKAVKSGNKDLVIGYNSWMYPSMTDFQDFYCGEWGINTDATGVGDPDLPPGGDGYFIAGPQKGLRATFCGQLEPGDWAHVQQDMAIPPPVLSSEALIRIVQQSIARKNVPIMNLSVYQDGTASPQSLELLTQLKEAIH